MCQFSLYRLQTGQHGTGLQLLLPLIPASIKPLLTELHRLCHARNMQSTAVIIKVWGFTQRHKNKVLVDTLSRDRY